MASAGTGILWSICWVIGLLIIGWPVAGFCAGFYVFCLPFASCIEPCKEFVEFLLKGVQFPGYFGDNIKAQKEMC